MKVVAKPAMDDETVSFWWEVKGNTMSAGAHASDREYKFIPKDTKPINVIVHAKGVDAGDDFGKKSMTVTATPYTIKVSEPKTMGPTPQIWKEGQGLVDVKNAIAVFQNVTLKASVSPNPKNKPLSYKWSVAPEGCTLSSPTSQEVTANASQTGTYSLSIAVKDSKGLELGTGKGSLSVTVSQQQMNTAKQKNETTTKKVAVSKEKLKKGKLDETIKEAEEALVGDPNNREAKKLIEDAKQEKEKAKKGLEKVTELINASDFKQAQDRFFELKKKYPYHPPVQKMEKQLQDARMAHINKVKAAIGNVKVKSDRRDYKEALEAVEHARNNLKLSPSELITLSENETYLKPLVAKKEKAIELFASSKQKFESGDYKGCIDDYLEGFNLTPNMWNVNTDKTVNNAGEIYREAVKKNKEQSSKTRTPEEISHAKGFEGKFNSEWGELDMKVDGARVTASYPHDQGRIEAVLSEDGKTMTGTWAEAPTYKGPKDGGKVTFTISPDKKSIDGLWGYGDAAPTKKWNGSRIDSSSSGREAEAPSVPEGSVSADNTSKDAKKYFQMNFAQNFNHKRPIKPYKVDGVPVAGYNDKEAYMVCLGKCQTQFNDGFCYPENYEWSVGSVNASQVWFTTNLFWWGNHAAGEPIARVTVTGDKGTKIYDMIGNGHTGEWNQSVINPVSGVTVHDGATNFTTYESRVHVARFSFETMKVSSIKIDLLTAAKWGEKSAVFAIYGVTLVDPHVSTSQSTAIFDFESGNLNGWTQTGEAFKFQPTYGDNPTARGRRQASNHEGNYWIGGYEKRPSALEPAGATQGDMPQGTLTSPSFTIKASTMSFLIGGGCDINVQRVELLVDGNAVLKATGKCNESMERASWDVSAYKGKTAQVRIIDASSGGWAHINFDDLRFEGQGGSGDVSSFSEKYAINANGYQGTLIIKEENGKKTGVMIFGGKEELLRDVHMDSATLKFTRPIPGFLQVYTGKIQGGSSKKHVEGTFTQNGFGAYKWFADKQ